MSVKNYLELVVNLRKKHFQNNWKYCCFEDLILSEGVQFDRFLKKPKWIKKGIIKQCFKNCFSSVVENPDDLIYCEGYAAGLIPTHHAWLLYQGQVIDPTWHNRFKSIKYEYIGIPFKFNYVLKVAHETGYYGILDNFTQNYPLLKGEEKDSYFNKNFEEYSCAVKR